MNFYDLDFLNLVIAVIALLTALYSIWYTHKRDKFTIEIDQPCYYEHREYSPPQPMEYASPLTGSEFMESNARKNFSYYLSNKLPVLTINVTADKPLKWWSKTKSFTVNVSNFD